VNSRSTLPLEADPRRRIFTGRLAVLIDSESASAAELFARVMQLEKRGLVFGDKSAGRVMAAQQYMHQAGMDRVIVYGALVTTAEIRMADGQNLEQNGVVPDQEITLTANDLVSGRDPVLAAAAKVLDMNITAEEAGSLFPFRWTEQ
jgi:carboxyl-terminal processing protease